MLKMTNIGKTFLTGQVQTKALDQINLQVDEGEFVTITGPSGCGKTTFLNIAGLLESASTGQYLLDGEDVSHLGDRQRAKLRNQKIGFIFQSFNLMPDLNLFDNVDVPLRYRGLKRGERHQRIEEALTNVGLWSRRKHLPAQLSGGQQQRVAIARALAGSPRFLLADEPTGNLDSKTASGVMSLLHEINAKGTTIIMVTHDPVLAQNSRRNIDILDGQIRDDARRNTAAVA